MHYCKKRKGVYTVIPDIFSLSVCQNIKGSLLLHSQWQYTNGDTVQWISLGTWCKKKIRCKKKLIFQKCSMRHEFDLVNILILLLKRLIFDIYLHHYDFYPLQQHWRYKINNVIIPNEITKNSRYQNLSTKVFLNYSQIPI